MILDKLLPTDFFSGFIDGAFGLVAILVIGAACVYFWFRGNEKKKWNIDISIHKTIGDGEVWIPTIGKQDADEKGIVRFEGKLFNIDLPAVDSQFFSLSGKGVNRRHIDIWNPQPNVFLPMARDYLRINNRKYKRVSETQCMYCDYVNKCKEDNKDAKFSSDDFKIHIKELKEIPICTTHLNLYFKAKFKVVGEAPKEFLWVRAKERLLRSITKVAWYNQPWFSTAMLVAGGLAFVVITLKFGPDWFDKAMQTSAKSAVEVFNRGVINSCSNIPEPPIN